MLYEKFAASLRILTGIRTFHPLHAQWFLTSRCNYRCPSCTVWTQHPRNELSTNEVKRGLDALQKLRIVTLTFTGGKPTSTK